MTTGQKGRAPRAGAVTIDRGGVPGAPWRAYVPPFLPQHEEGGALVGPFGDTYHRTHADALGFAALVIAAGDLEHAAAPDSGSDCWDGNCERCGLAAHWDADARAWRHGARPEQSFAAAAAHLTTSNDRS